MNILADILYIAVVIYPGPGRFSGKCRHVKMALYCYSNIGELFKIEVKISQLVSLQGDCVHLKEAATTAQERSNLP